MNQLATQQQSEISPFADASSFDQAQRMAKLLASSSLVPKQYQGNVADCTIALEIANRLNISALSVLQNLDVIHGRPSFRAKMMIAAFNNSPDYGKIHYEWVGEEETEEWGCRAAAADLSDPDTRTVTGPLITIKLAKAEGWFNKSGSKWQTMPEKMLMYRAAAWFIDTYAPELMLAAPEVGGEIIDVEPIVITDSSQALGQAMDQIAHAKDEGRDIGELQVDEGGEEHKLGNLTQVSDVMLKSCGKCGGPIVWLKSQRSGRNYPVNADPQAMIRSSGGNYLQVYRDDVHECQAYDDGPISEDVAAESAGPSYDELTSQLDKAETLEDVYTIMSCADALNEEESSRLLQSCKAKQLALESGGDE